MGRYLDMVRRKEEPLVGHDALELRASHKSNTNPNIIGRDGGLPDWLAEWRELADKTAGLLPDDPRRGPVLDGLGRCDEAFLANDYHRFVIEKAAVLRSMSETAENSGMRLCDGTV